MERTQTFEQFEYPRNDPLRLLIGIFDDLARGLAYIAHGHGHTQFASASLRPFAFQHTLFEDM